MSPKPLIWKSGLRSTPAKPRATNIASEEWQANQDVIYQEYMVKDLPLKHVAQYMRNDHNFFATERQYTSQFEKWGWIKRSSHRRRRSSLHPSQSLIGTPTETMNCSQEQISLVHKASEDANELGLVETSSIEGSHGTEELDDLDAEEVLNTSAELVDDPPRYSTVFGPPLVTQDLPSAVNSNESILPPLATSDECEEEGAVFSLSSVDDESPTISNSGYTDLSNLVKSTIFSPISEISMQLLTAGGRYDGTILLNSIKPKTAKTLENIFRREYTQMQAGSVSDDDLKELCRTSDFLFVAQSYEDSFTLSRITCLLIEKCVDDSHSSFHIGNSPAWLTTTINMTRSATTMKDTKQVVQVLKKIRSRNDFDTVKNSKDYNLLQAFLGDVLHELSDHKDSHKAAVACWVKLLAQPLDLKYPLSRRIMSSKIQETLIHNVAQDLPVAMYLKLRIKLKEEESRVGVCVKDGILSANAIVVLQWCAENLAYDEFYFMMSNIDEVFWNARPHDVEIFERIVVYCYLCERLWRLERLHRADLLVADCQVLHALNSMQEKTGLSNVAVLYSIVNICRHIVTSMADIPTRLTLPVRYKTSMEAFHEKCRSTGFENNSGYFTMSINNLIDHSGWPGKITSLQNQLHDRVYAWSVRIFLREFVSVNLELDLTKRLHQAEDRFRDGRISIGSAAFAPTARSSQMSEDYVAFKTAAKRVSHEDARSSHGSVQPPTTGLDDLTSDVSNHFRLFRYSGSARGSMTTVEDLESKPDQRSSNRMSICGKETNSDDRSLTRNTAADTDGNNSFPDAELVSEMNRMSF